MEKTVLVTGCSSGIGHVTARAFHHGGWEVYATARERNDITDLANRGLQTAELDVTDDDEVSGVVDRIETAHGSVDCLVNNAGYGQFGPIEDIPTEKVAEQFDVNTFGPIRLVQAVLPGMRERGDGTIINVTAGIGGFTAPGLGIYTASKFALESATDALRQEVSQFGVDVTIVEPGFVATDFYDRAISEVDEIEHSAAYPDLYRALESIGLFERPFPGINRPERVARTILRVANADQSDPVYRVGPVATVGTAAGALLRGHARDRASQLGLSLLANDRVQAFLPTAGDS